MVEGSLVNPQLSVRLETMAGLLYLLQSLTSDDDRSGLLPHVADFVSVEIDAALAIVDFTAVLSRPQSMQYQLILWAVGIYIAESFHDGFTKNTFVPKFIEQCQRALTLQTVPQPVLEAVVCGLESLVTTSSVTARHQLSKFSSEMLRNAVSAQHSVLALELLSTCLYCGLNSQSSGDRASESETLSLVPDSQLSAMEQLTHLFNKVSGGSCLEASGVGAALAEFLTDNFSPGDVMNRVISELLMSGQPHPRILLRVLAALFDSLRDLEQCRVVSDWALLSVPSFSHKTPVGSAASFMTAFLVCAAENVWIRNMFLLLLDRVNYSEDIDNELFRFVLSGFRNQLDDESQIQSLVLSMKNAQKRHPGSVFDNDWK